jgi:N-acetylglucosaminyl-diphospho-decaprenol L-rhamnosyltransferase
VDVDLSIIVVSYNTRELLSDCLTSIADTVGDLACETIVVDNNSTDASAPMVRRYFPNVRLIRSLENRGFAAANNLGIAASRGRHVLLLNSDAVLLPGAARTMVDFLDAHPGAGMVGARLLNPDGSFQYSYADFPSLTGELLLLTRLAPVVYTPDYPSYPVERSAQERSVDWVSGACLMARRATIDAIGPLDESYFMYTEETDWCYRARRGGWSVHYLPDASVVHWGGQSAAAAPARRRRQVYRSKCLFLRKHVGWGAAATFALAVGAVSALKLGAVVPLALVAPDGARRARARNAAHSYALVLAGL